MSNKSNIDVSIRNYYNKDISETYLADLFVLSELNGGVGLDLAKTILIPYRIPFAVITKDGSYNSIIRHASAVFYETEWQKMKLTHRSWRFWRTALNQHQLIKLPKSVDTRHFARYPDIPKDYDIVVKEKVIDNHKDFKSIFKLSRRLKIGVIGDTPELENLRIKYPEITWFGGVSYADVPFYINRGKLFLHSGFQNIFADSIVEAMACGVPPIVFDDTINKDMIPGEAGLIVSRKNFYSEISNLLEQPDKIFKISQFGRKYAERNWNHLSTQSAITKLISRINKIDSFD